MADDGEAGVKRDVSESVHSVLRLLGCECDLETGDVGPAVNFRHKFVESVRVDITGAHYTGEHSYGEHLPPRREYTADIERHGDTAATDKSYHCCGDERSVERVVGADQANPTHNPQQLCRDAPPGEERGNHRAAVLHKQEERQDPVWHGKGEESPRQTIFGPHSGKDGDVDKVGEESPHSQRRLDPVH